MISKNKARIPNSAGSTRYSSKVKKAGEMADQALKRYGEPTMSLSELRAKLSHHLQGISVSDVILKDREAKW